jgi:hypothetical protein
MALRRVEDKPTPKEVYSEYKFLACPHISADSRSGRLAALPSGTHCRMGRSAVWVRACVSVPHSTQLPFGNMRAMLHIVFLYIRRYDSAFIGGTIDLPAFQSQFGLEKMSASQLAFTSANIVSTYQAGEYFSDFYALAFSTEPI